MNRSVRVMAGLAILLVVFSAAGCTKLKARDQLNKGVQSYKNSRYEEAIEHFKNAVSMDPSLLNARLYLATAYAQQYIPGAETEENKRMAGSAIEEYKQVLMRDPKNINAIKGIAYLYLQMKDFDQAKQYYQKSAAVDSNDPENYYSIAVIDWTQAYKLRQEQRAKLGMKPTDQLRDKKVCNFVMTNNQAPVEEGIKMLQKALQIRPDYDDAMAYLNLLYRERADYECGDAVARAADIKTANDWVDKTLATKKAKAEKQSGGGIVIDQKIGQKIEQNQKR
ncbi:MAG: tetratricopeptide repeat protein [Candidatus Korobacteraceae bacterium]